MKDELYLEISEEIRKGGPKREKFRKRSLGTLRKIRRRSGYASKPS